MNEQLFLGKLVRLTAFDADKDAETESRWTHDAEYLRLLSPNPARPLSSNQIKKKYDEDKERNRFRFAIRTRAEDRLIGFIHLAWVEWNNGTAFLTLGIGDAADRGKGCGSDAMEMILRYAFAELNLFRLTTLASEDNPRGLDFFTRRGFQIEVRRREAIHREGARCDGLVLGMLKEEWKSQS